MSRFLSFSIYKFPNEFSCYSKAFIYTFEQELAIPLVMENKNLALTTNPGVGKTLIAAAAIKHRIDSSCKHTQAVFVVESFSVARQTIMYLNKLYAFTNIKIGLAAGLDKSFVTHFDFHVLVGTPKGIQFVIPSPAFCSSNLPKFNLILLFSIDFISLTEKCWRRSNCSMCLTRKN